MAQGGLLRGGLLFGCGLPHRVRLLRRLRHPQVGVVLLPGGRLGLAGAGPGGPGPAASLVVLAIGVPIGGHVGLFGPVGSH